MLNAEHAPSPRPQQGRPAGWCPSSVREALFRTAYHGTLTWNRSKKRTSWGEVKATARPESEWLVIPAADQRIVSEAVWSNAHARLATTRANYLRVAGRLWGRPLDGTARRFLLTGLAKCPCGSGLELRSRASGGRRIHYYSCAAYWRKGRHVCSNKMEIDQVKADEAVLAVVEETLLTEPFVESVVAKVLSRRPSQEAADEARARLRQQLAEQKRELGRLVTGLARGSSPAIADAIRAGEQRQEALERELAGLDQRQHLSDGDISRLEALARAKVMDWKATMGRNTSQARQILQKLLRDRLVSTRERRNTYAFAGEGSLTRLLSGAVTEFRSLAFSTGTIVGCTSPITGIAA